MKPPLWQKVKKNLRASWWKWKSEKVGLQLNIQKTKIMASSPITSWEIDRETVADFISWGSKITADGDWSHEIKRCLLLGRKVMTNLVQFIRSVVSDSLGRHGPQHARPPCSSPTPGVCPNSCPLSQWCHPTISSSVIPFSCPQSFLASGSFLMSKLFAAGGQSIGVSASTSVLLMNNQDWFSLGWTGCNPRDSQKSSPTPQFKSNNSVFSFLYSPTFTSIHDYWKNHSLY